MLWKFNIQDYKPSSSDPELSSSSQKLLSSSLLFPATKQRRKVHWNNLSKEIFMSNSSENSVLFEIMNWKNYKIKKPLALFYQSFIFPWNNRVLHRWKCFFAIVDLNRIKTDPLFSDFHNRLACIPRKNLHRISFRVIKTKKG